MTIFGWVLFAIIAGFLVLAIIGAFISYIDTKWKVIVLILCLVGIIGSFAGFLWYFNNTESGKRSLKTQKSNLEGGIQREVRVYDATGGLIETYDGKFDVKYDDDRILFDDENGKRHTIYYPTGTVIIDEVEVGE